MNKGLSVRTKIQASITFVVIGLLIFSSGYAWTIKEGEDSTGQLYHGTTGLITTSNGKAWTATGTNLQLAIHDLNGTGGTVNIPSTRITLTNVLDQPGNVILSGEGMNNTIIIGADDTNVIEVSEGNTDRYGSIKDLSIRAEGTSTAKTDF